jgi:hypothetical protein
MPFIFTSFLKSLKTIKLALLVVLPLVLVIQQLLAEWHGVMNVIELTYAKGWTRF